MSAPINSLLLPPPRIMYGEDDGRTLGIQATIATSPKGAFRYAYENHPDSKAMFLECQGIMYWPVEEDESHQHDDKYNDERWFISLKDYRLVVNSIKIGWFRPAQLDNFDETDGVFGVNTWFVCKSSTRGSIAYWTFQE